MSTLAAIRKHNPPTERQPLQLEFFHYVFLFLLTSFIGLAGEVLVSYVIDGRWESRAGFIVGPFSPLYGCGAILMTLALNPLRNRNMALQFVIAAVAGGLLEFIAGSLLKYRYGIVAWSYVDRPLNFDGHTCIEMMAVWGFLGICWVTWALPRCVNLIERIPSNVRKPLTIAAFLFIAANSVLTVACLDSWFWRSVGFEPHGPVQQFCATFFGDDFMSKRFETMGMYTSLASR